MLEVTKLSSAQLCCTAYELLYNIMFVNMFININGNNSGPLLIVASRIVSAPSDAVWVALGLIFWLLVCCVSRDSGEGERLGLVTKRLAIVPSPRLASRFCKAPTLLVMHFGDHSVDRGCLAPCL